jgi:chemotaxis protein MotB
MRRRMRRREEEHENHERWAIPYGDLLTLLLAFFVVMYSISSVNAGKYRVLSDSLYAAFRGEPRTLEPIQVGHKRQGSGADIRVSIVQQATLKGQPRSLLAPVPLALSTPIPNAPYHDDMPPPGNENGLRAATGPAHPMDPAQAAAAAKAAAAAIMLTRVADDVVKAMSGLVKQKLVMVRRKQYWIEVEIRTDILYPSGSARLAPNAIGIIRRLADVLARFPNPIRVEGFTDNVPIRTVQFYSNWELSAARAGSVVHVLSDRGVARDRLAVVGFGDQHPVASNATAQGRNANRRVTVVILSTAGDGHNEPGWVPNTDSSGGTTTGQPTADATAPATAPAGTAAASTAAASLTPANTTAVGATAAPAIPTGGTAAVTPASGTVPAR